MHTRDFRARAIVLRRTDYKEADRILNILTPIGKKAVVAKGVRREKSKLAGAVEMLSLSEVVVHEGKGEMGVLTGARLVEFYGEILKEYERLELATEIMRKVGRTAEQVDSPEFFEILEQGLRGLNDGIGLATVRLWTGVRLARVSGEEVNLWTDVSGEKLSIGERYEWDGMERAMRAMKTGSIRAEEIKLLRLMMSGALEVVARVIRVEERSKRLLESGVVR